MCVTNIYVDVYPDGRTRKSFSQTSICQYGIPGRPCAAQSIIENPPRKIQWDEPTTEFILTQHQRGFPTLPHTPPRSAGGSSHHSDESLRRRDSKRRSGSSRTEPRREHKKERIIIVDSPPTPRTPPQAFRQTFTAPNSPVSRGRPIIVDERPRLPPKVRVPSVGAVVGERPRRSTSSSRPHWDSPSSSHTSFDLQTQAEERARAEAKHHRNERIAELEAERRRAERIRAHDEAIKRRPAVPLASTPSRNRAFLAPVVDQTQTVQGMMGGMRLNERVVASDRIPSVESRRRNEEREAAAKLRKEEEEAQAMKQRLRERQMPGRRFSVGPAQRRERVLYSDGVYRYE